MIRMSRAQNLAFLMFASVSISTVGSASAAVSYLFLDAGDVNPIVSSQLDPNRDNDTDWALGFGGGLRFANGVGIELAKAKLGQDFHAYPYGGDPPQYFLERLDTDSVGLFASYQSNSEVGRPYFGARAGLHRWTQTSSIADYYPGQTARFQNSKTDAAVGLELGWRWHPNWTTALTWTHYAISESSDGRLALRLAYQFE